VIVIALILGLLASAAEAADVTRRLPLGLEEQAAWVPEDNPMTAEKIALGRQLHDPKHGWADPRRFSLRFDGNPTPRHSPTLVNRLFSVEQQWAGTRASLEDQAIKASDQSPELLVKNLGAIAGYREQFQKVFGTELTPEGVAKAIAAYERAILSGNAPYDRFRAGETAALSASARRGLALFSGKARCAPCHAGFNFTDEGYHNIGVGMDRDTPDLGRFTVTKVEAHKGTFKTPTLRDVARRPPFMHDGSVGSLADVVALYNRGGVPNPWLSSAIEPLNLTTAEQQDLVAFLEALTGEVDATIASPPQLPD
jgi:cytochrome c peroxidase